MIRGGDGRIEFDAWRRCAEHSQWVETMGGNDGRIVGNGVLVEDAEVLRVILDAVAWWRRAEGYSI